MVENEGVERNEFVKEELEKLQEETLVSLSQASTEKEVSEIRIAILGRKGRLTLLLEGFRNTP